MTSIRNQQIIDFNEYDENIPSFVHSRHVVVRPSSHTQDNDSKASNKITTQNVVDYSWEDRYTLGHLISFHCHTKLVAYVLSISNNYMIRVLNEENSSRCLIKEFSGEITDIGFSRSRLPYIASIDVNGSVKITKVIVTMDTLDCQVMLNIKAAPGDMPTSLKISYSRVMWCCHSDDDVNEEDESAAEAAGTNISLLLGIVHGATFEVLQVDTIESELSARSEVYDGKIDRIGLQAIASSYQEQYAGTESLTDLFLPYLFYTAPKDGVWITSLAISSDAAAFAVGVQTGAVHFFTLDGSAPSGLKEAYSWQPFEDSEPVWSLLFLDDSRPGSNTDSFWCHVVVGGAFNRQLKLYRCDKWDCVQTVTFQAPTLPCLMSAHVDQSASFLIMSDIRRKALYMLEIDSIDGGTTKLFKSVQEFVLTQPLLSFDINSITITPLSDGGHQVVLKLFTITKTAFQKMRVTYISKGHRLKEIIMDDDDDNEEEEEEEEEDIRRSVLTKVSSLPSTVTNSFQDPAIISTHLMMNKTPPVTTVVTDNNISSSEIPVTLQHLFSSLTTSSTINNHQQQQQQKDLIVPLNCLSDDNSRCAGNITQDSGDESEDEASIDGLVSIIHEQRCADNFKDPEEQSGFPLPPYASNSGNWKSSSLMNDIGNYGTNNGTKEQCLQSADNNDKSLKEMMTMMDRMADMMNVQRMEMELLTKSVREMKCNCKESKQVWSEEAAKKVSEGCERSVGGQLGPCVRQAMDAVLPRITGDIGARLGEDVKSRLGAVEPVMKEFLNDLLHDKKFIGYMSGVMADALEKSLKVVYADMVKRELVPCLGRTLDKVMTDTREVMKEGIKEVMKGITEDSQKQHQLYKLEAETMLKKMTVEVSNVRVNMVEVLNQQTIQMARLHESMQALKDTAANNAMSDFANHNEMSRGNSFMNVSGGGGAGGAHVAVDSIAIREQKINKLISTNNFGAALDEALSLTNLRMLLSTCLRIRPSKVLSGNSQKQSSLPSSSILALIQQLSRDFNDHLDLKIEYLFDAMLSLDTEDHNIREHVSKVLRGVVRRLQAHLDSENSNINRDRVTMLLRLVSSRLDSSQD